MSIQDDTWHMAPEYPDRVHYATGVLLDAGDFYAEQNYHRGRLATALLYLMGSGTVAGLKVEWEDSLEPGGEFPDGRDERLVVHPGIAIDRLGRIIEVPRAWCIRLDGWYNAQDADELQQGFKPPPLGSVVVDVFVRFVACERGKTPAFASGPFDALDAVQPSRLRDAHHMSLVIRKDSNPPTPHNRWTGLPADATATEMHEAILNPLTSEQTKRDSNGELTPLREHVDGQDVTDLFLARVTIPAESSADGLRPTRTEESNVIVDNQKRAFVYNPVALAKRDGITFEAP